VKVLEEPVQPTADKVKTASAVIGTLVGLSLGGPLIALLCASVIAYSTTQESDLGEASRGVSEASIQAYNFAVKVTISDTHDDPFGGDPPHLRMVWL